MSAEAIGQEDLHGVVAPGKGFCSLGAALAQPGGKKQRVAVL